MVVADYLARLTALSIGPVDALIGDKPFVILSPHADDETLGCGGLLALTAGTSRAGRVLILTDGAGSHPGSVAYPPDRLVRLRETESRSALRHLGLPDTAIDFLGAPDTALPSSGPLFDKIVESIVASSRRIGAGTLFVTWGCDPHCDHEAATVIAITAARALRPLRLWAYPIWGWHLDPAAAVDADPPTGFRLDISTVRTAKRDALACYASQMTGLIDDDPNGFCFNQTQLAPFLGRYETFIAMQP